MSHRDLLAYWPHAEDVAACVKTDAEASSEAVSLAVHQSMRFERRVIGGDGNVVEYCDEYELLRAFTAVNLSEGRVILPIVGSAGIGKSHVVRWLGAQLARLPNANRRIVIPIPKGTSLRGALSILLDKLPEGPYEQYRKELARAQQELDPREAAGLLCEMLAHTLEEMANQARTNLRANPNDRTAQEIDAYCGPGMLPALLRNQLLRDHHFVRNTDGGDGVVKRLVEQLTEGRAAGADDDRQHLFVPDDLRFDDRLERDALGRDEKRAIDKFEREDRRVAATRILNTALDDAKQRLLRLDPTVSDLFDAVRKELLAENKELILLIEDFAVLSGLQKQFLQVIIKHAIEGGRQILCTMRTAIAYTTGYMDTATVLTRANVEYRIADEPGSETEILDRIERLVGAYLNAARLGQARLEDEYRRSVAASDRSREWVPKFSANIEPDALATLDAFGATADGYQLFPFNREAVDELAREGCVQAGRLVYNPRFVIQNVINKVLFHREFFENNTFPPTSFGALGRRLPARVTEDVKRRVPTAELDRYLRFFVYWGGCPEVPAEIGRVAPRVFAAFGLDNSLFDHEYIPPPPPTPKPNGDDGAVHQDRSIDPIEAKWETTLEAWRSGIPIPQSEANQLRTWIVEALREFIDLNWDLFRPLARDTVTWTRWFREGIYIPNAAGHAGRTENDAMVVICKNEDLADHVRSSRIQANLLAVVRFYGVHGGIWDYDGAEEDLPRFATLIEDLASRARSYVRARYFRAEWDPVPAIVESLLIGARLLGIEGAARDDHSALIASLFSPSMEAAPRALEASSREMDEWLAFKNALRSCRRATEREAREQVSWTGHLLNLIGARQGPGDIVYAIDLVRLRPAIQSVTKAWEFSQTPPNAAGVTEFAAFRTTYLDLKRQSSVVTKAQRNLRDWRTRTIAWLGSDVDKDALIRELRETVDAAKAAGLTRGIETKRVLDLLEVFRTGKVIAAMDDAARLDDEAPRGTVLSVLGRDYGAITRVCDELYSHFDAFIAAVDQQLRGEEMKFGSDPLADARATVVSAASQLSVLLKELQ